MASREEELFRSGGNLYSCVTGRYRINLWNGKPRGTVFLARTGNRTSKCSKTQKTKEEKNGREEGTLADLHVKKGTKKRSQENWKGG